MSFYWNSIFIAIKCSHNFQFLKMFIYVYQNENLIRICLITAIFSFLILFFPLDVRLKKKSRVKFTQKLFRFLKESL